MGESEMKTQSEAIFERYCDLNSYDYERIPAGSAHGPTPDYRVHRNRISVIVEIKELCPNDDDLFQAREFEKHGESESGDIPGRRVNLAIGRAAKQLKKYSDEDLPCVLLLYDNAVDVDGRRLYPKGSLLGPASIDFGMYGQASWKIALSRDRAKLASKGFTRDGDRQLTHEQRRYISAVSVLTGCYDDSPCIFTYHNFFAERPLPTSLFRSSRDRHFAKQRRPDQEVYPWVEIVD